MDRVFRYSSNLYSLILYEQHPVKKIVTSAKNAADAALPLLDCDGQIYVNTSDDLMPFLSAH